MRDGKQRRSREDVVKSLIERENPENDDDGVLTYEISLAETVEKLFPGARRRA